MKTTLTLFSVLLFLSKATAADINLFKVTNRVDNETYQMILETDGDDKAIGLKLWDPHARQMVRFSVRNLKNWAILKQEGKHQVIRMRSGDFEFDRGGHLTVDYLYSGVSGKRRDFEITVDFDGTTWVVYFNGRKVNNMVFHPNTFLGKVVGIEKVDVR